jgi:ParB family transcriptional regulator, chromosome partitioning protein
MTRKALGKGLSAIIPEETQQALASEARPIALTEIRPNPFQPRQQVVEDLAELVASVREKGVIQPVLVRRRRDGYELVSGERRFRAAQQAGLAQIPAVVRSVDDREMLELALVENLQRKNLNPVDEGMAYKRLADEFKLTHEEIAQKVGKDRSTVTNAVRLLELPFKVRDALAAGQITAGHARPLLGVTNRRVQVEICERTVKEGLSVRAVERLCGEARPTKPRRPPVEKDVHIRALEESLQEYLGTRVRIEPLRSGTGRLVIEFHSDEDLTRLIGKIRPGR